MRKQLFAMGILVISFLSLSPEAKADYVRDAVRDTDRLIYKINNTQNNGGRTSNEDNLREVYESYYYYSRILVNLCWDGNKAACKQHEELQAAYTNWYNSRQR